MLNRLNNLFPHFEIDRTRQTQKVTPIRTSNISFRGTQPSTDIFERSQVPEKKDINNLSKHYNNPIKLVCSDIDGTIVSHKDDSCHEDNIKAFKALEDANIPLILATGRSKDRLEKAADKCGITCDYYIINQGATILDKNRNVIKETPLQLDDVKNVYDLTDKLIEKHGITKIYLFADGERYGVDCSQDKETRDKTKAEILDMLEKENKAPVMMIIDKKGNEDQSEMDSIRETITDGLPEDNLVDIMVGSPHSCEVLYRGVSKANSLDSVAKSKGVSPSNIAGIGDGDNDRQMMQYLKKNGGLSIAISGGYPKLCEECSFITSRAEDAGFAVAMKNILKNNERLEKRSE